MPWLYIGVSIAAGAAAAGVLCLLLLLALRKREPYAGFLRLSHRRKLSFFRLLAKDSRVPLCLKLLLLAAVVYFVSPIDFLPGIIVDDIAFALAALIIVIKFMPGDVLQSLLEEAAGAEQPPSAEGVETPT